MIPKGAVRLVILWPAIVCSTVAIWCHDDSDSSNTSTTTTRSSTSRSSVTSTTDTTVPTLVTGIEDLFSAVVTLTLADRVTVGALQVDVGYRHASGHFHGWDGRPPCTASIPELLIAQSNDTANQTLRISIITLGGLGGPSDLVRCHFLYTSQAPVPADFHLTIAEATAPDLTPIIPQPTIEISVDPSQ